nr:putative ribonuclease H-like domain-containing protein [Tanacetum cinerariifolium]
DTGLKKNVDVGHTKQEKVYTQKYIVFPLWSSISSSYKSSDDKAGDNTTDDAAGKEKVEEPVSEYDQALKNVLERMINQEKKATEQSNDVRKEFQAQCNSQLLQENVTRSNSHNSITTVSTPVNTGSASRAFIPSHNPLMPELEDTAEIQTTGIFGNYDKDDLETNNHSYANESVGVEADFNNMEPSTAVIAIPTTRVHSNHPKVDYRRSNVSSSNKGNKAKLVAQGHKQEEGIDYDEVFAPVARVEAIMLFLAFASYMTFLVYQMDVKSVFLYGTIEEEINDWVIDVSYILKTRYYVQPKVSHLHAVKRIFRDLKGQPKLGIWYPKDSPLTLEAFSDSDYAGVSLDRKFITGGCQFRGSRLISWQCKKQTVVANSTTKAKYIAASHCCGQVLWIHNQIMDYGYNFMQTKIHVDNESAIRVIKNHVYHSKIKHIEIRHHFIRDSYEKKLIEMVKIHTNNNVVDLLTKAFDVGDEAVHKELGDRMEKVATTASSLEAEQDNEFYDKHNMVAYLEKSEGSEGFHQIVDFLSASHIKYALKENPTIYASLIEQFWQNAALSTIEDEVMAITATNDKNVKVLITEASIRRHLKLGDSKDLMEILYTSSRITSSPSLSPQHTSINAPSTSQPPNIQTTPVAEETTPMPHDSPLQSVHSLGRDEGSLSLNELTVLYTSLSIKFQSLENELQQTKKVYSFALTKLILRVKKLKRIVKTSKARRKARIVISEDEDAKDPSKQRRSLIEELDIDVDISLVPPHAVDQGRKSNDTQVSGQPEDQLVSTADVSTASEMVNTAGLKAKDKAIDIARKEKVVAEGDQAHDIDWSDPAGGFKLSHFKGMSYEDIRPVFKKVWDQIHSFVPMNSELEVQRSKRTVQEVERQSNEEEKGKKNDDSSKPTRKKTLARKRVGGNDSQQSVKKQKLKDDTEKKELKAYVDIVLEDEFVMEVESLATKEMLDDFDKHDVYTDW